LDDRARIDEIDVRILKALLKDARTTYADIARECGISSNSIKLRFERLKKAGIIKSSITQVNPKSLGYNYIAFITIQTDANRKQYNHKFLKNIPNIIHATKLMGRYNLMIVVAFADVKEIDEVVTYIKRNPHIIKVNVAIAWDLVNVDHPENLEIKECEEK